MNLITENSQKWSQIISEEFGVKNPQKLSWMSQYAQNHEIFESVQTTGVRADAGIYTTPLNTLGMGNPMMPMGVAGVDGFNANGVHGVGIGNTGADFHNPMYKTGSGDIPMSTLTMSLEVAAMTIGLELVPVIPANGPWAMLSYMDFPYAGGKMGRINETALDGKGELDALEVHFCQYQARHVGVAQDVGRGHEVEGDGHFVLWYPLSHLAPGCGAAGPDRIPPPPQGAQTHGLSVFGSVYVPAGDLPAVLNGKAVF